MTAPSFATTGTESDDIELGQTFLYIGDGWLLTVQRSVDGEATDLRDLLERTPARLRDETMSAAYTIMADVVDGYAKAAGKPMAVACHGTVGLQHAAMAVYNAWCDYVPVVII